MISMALVGAKKFIKDVNQYLLKKPQAVARALNAGVLRIRNTSIISMKKTPRKVFGPNVAPPLLVEEFNDTPQSVRRRGKHQVKKGSAHANQRGGHEHAPSVPGFPPAIDTGRLINSIRVDFVNTVRPPANQVAEVSTALSYARRLEYGWGMNPRRNRRPWLRPAFTKELPKIRKDVQAAFRGKGVY